MVSNPDFCFTASNLIFVKIYFQKKGSRYEFPNRFIFIGNTIPDGIQPPADYDRQKYPDNEVISSKYTVLNFLPKNLFEQFRRIANTYFLLIGIIMVTILFHKIRLLIVVHII